MKLKDVRVGTKVVPHSKSAKANTQTEPDPVNNPSHYTNGEIECIDAIKSAITGLVGMEAFCTGQILKYSWRWKHKNGKEDLEKARYYINKLIDEITVEK